MSEQRRKRLSAITFVIFLLFCLFVMIYVGIPMVRLARQPELFRDWVDSFGFLGRLIFVAMVIVQVVVALIPGEPLELAAGYAFGAVEGTFLALAGILLGSFLVFMSVRLWGVKLVQIFFAEKEIRRLSFLRDPRKAKALLFILMVIPGTPKDLLSYFSGLTPITIWQWLSIVAIARIPSLVTSTISGAAAGEENYVLAGCVFTFTLLLSGLGILYYKNICKESDEKSC